MFKHDFIVVINGKIDQSIILRNPANTMYVRVSTTQVIPLIKIGYWKINSFDITL